MSENFREQADDLSMKKILHVTKAKFPPEIRVVKESLSLCQAGYRLAVLCPSYGDEPTYEVWKGIEIFRPRLLGRRPFFEKLFELVTLCSPAWYWSLRKVLSRYQPDVLHVHDIWLGRVAFAARTSQMVVMDLHENMPAATVEYLGGYKGLQRLCRRLFHSHQRIFAYERGLLQSSDMILAVVQEAHERILQDHPSLAPEKVTNVENLESKRFVSGSKVGRASFLKDHFSILYIGGFGPHRGLETLVRAMVSVKKSTMRVKVQLIGARPSQYLEMLKQLICECGVESHVQITGWVNVDDVVANIQQADVCCVPHHSNAHTDTTIPHKLFQYMTAKRPVLVSSSAPLARSVRQSGAGLVFNAGDQEDCAKKIMELANSPVKCSSYGESGYRYVKEKGHNWEDESEPKLIKAYDRLFARRTKAEVT